MIVNFPFFLSSMCQFFFPLLVFDNLLILNGRFSLIIYKIPAGKFIENIWRLSIPTTLFSDKYMCIYVNSNIFMFLYSFSLVFVFVKCYHSVFLMSDINSIPSAFPSYQFYSYLHYTWMRRKCMLI